MPNRFFLAALAAAVSLLPVGADARLICNSGNCYTRTTNPPTNDLWCNGGQVAGNVVKAYTEICQDSTGSLIATSTQGVQNLGTATLPWDNVYSINSANSGSQSVGTPGSTPASGTGGTAATQDTLSGLIVFSPVSITGIYNSTTVPVNASSEVLLSTGSIIMSGTPEISTTTVVGGSTLLPSGTYLVLTSTTPNTTITFSSSGTVAGSGLVLGAATRTLATHSVLTLILNTSFNPALWVEQAYTHN